MASLSKYLYFHSEILLERKILRSKLTFSTLGDETAYQNLVIYHLIPKKYFHK